MDLQLQDKVVIITGGAQGIGAACVELFSAEAAIPVVVERSPDAARELIEKCGKGKVIEADLASVDACERAIAETLEAYGRIDGIVHNAATNDAISLRHSVDDFLRSLQINLVHVFALTHYALDALIESRGFIVSISSKVAVTGQGGTSGYAAAKGAVNGLTREWALELAKHGIRVNAIAPAEVDTPSYRGWAETMEDPQGFLDNVRAHVPFGRRMTRPEEIANLVAFLSSERSAHTTGQIVYPDGGYVHLDRIYRPEK